MSYAIKILTEEKVRLENKLNDINTFLDKLNNDQEYAESEVDNNNIIKGILGDAEFSMPEKEFLEYCFRTVGLQMAYMNVDFDILVETNRGKAKLPLIIMDNDGVFRSEKSIIKFWGNDKIHFKNLTYKNTDTDIYTRINSEYLTNKSIDRKSKIKVVTELCEQKGIKFKIY